MDFTTRLGLNKPNPDPVTGDFVDVTKLNENADSIDSSISFTVCTSTSRPSPPFQGQAILETDTGIAQVWGGSAWIPILISKAEFTGNLGIGTVSDGNNLRKITVNSGGTNGSLSQVLLKQTGSASGSRALSTMGGGDTQDRFWIDFDGKMQWAPAGSGGDTVLYRSTTDVLRTDDSFSANAYQVNGNQARVLTFIEEKVQTSPVSPLATNPTWSDLTGVSINFTTLKPNAIVEFSWTVDFELNGTSATGIVAIATTNLDGTDVGANAVWRPGNVSSARQTVSQGKTVTVASAGVHVAKLRARTEVAGTSGNTVRANDLHSRLTCKVFE